MNEWPNVGWPDKKTAFLVIHGIHEHKTYESLGYFLRGFWKVLEKIFGKENIIWTHKYRKCEEII